PVRGCRAPRLAQFRRGRRVRHRLARRRRPGRPRGRSRLVVAWPPPPSGRPHAGLTLVSFLLSPFYAREQRPADNSARRAFAIVPFPLSPFCSLEPAAGRLAPRAFAVLYFRLSTFCFFWLL